MIISRLNKISLTYLSEIFRVSSSLKSPDLTLLSSSEEGTEDETADLTDESTVSH